MPEGTVRFTVGAQVHAYKRHEDEFMRCFPFLSETLTSPSHVGQAPKHKHDGFELIKVFAQQPLITLMAVGLRMSNDSHYDVNSVYPIDEDALARRVRKGFVVKV